MHDPQIGISVRFVRQFDIAKDRHGVRQDMFASKEDAAQFLARFDSRDVPLAQKVADVLARLQSPDQISDTESPR